VGSSSNQAVPVPPQLGGVKPCKQRGREGGAPSERGKGAQWRRRMGRARARGRNEAIATLGLKRCDGHVEPREMRTHALEQPPKPRGHLPAASTCRSPKGTGSTTREPNFFYPDITQLISVTVPRVGRGSVQAAESEREGGRGPRQRRSNGARRQTRTGAWGVQRGHCHPRPQDIHVATRRADQSPRRPRTWCSWRCEPSPCQNTVSPGWTTT
jgi:hypothetical protein